MKNAMNWTALLLSTLALVLAVYVAVRPLRGVDQSAIEQAVYRRIVSETWRELAPAFKDFHVEVSREPETISQLVKPLLSIEPKLDQP